MRSNLGGDPRPLSVWVAAHELGHVLGLHHRDGHNCSVMSPRAFDTNCAPSLAASRPTVGRAGLRARAGRRRRGGGPVRRRRGHAGSALSVAFAPRDRLTPERLRNLDLHRDVGAGRRDRRDQPRPGLPRRGRARPRCSRPRRPRCATATTSTRRCPGVPALRAAIAEHQQRFYGLDARGRPGDDGRDRGDHGRDPRAGRARRGGARVRPHLRLLRRGGEDDRRAAGADPAAPARVALRPGRAARRDHAEDARDPRQLAAQPDRPGAQPRGAADDRRRRRSSTT